MQIPKIDAILRNYAPFTRDVMMKFIEDLEILIVTSAVVSTRTDMVRSSDLHQSMHEG